MPPTEWIDDPNISNDERLWRRVPPGQFKTNNDGKRPSSAAFKDRSKLLSVNRASLTTVEETLAGHSGFGLAEFTAGLARSINCIIMYTPKSDNTAHSDVISTKRTDGLLTSSQASEIARNSELIVHPSN